MRAVVISQHGGPDILRIQNIEDPVTGPEDVLAEIKATSLNCADLVQRRGNYPARSGIRQNVPGLEMSGIVTETGQRVLGLLRGGGYAAKVAIRL